MVASLLYDMWGKKLSTDASLVSNQSIDGPGRNRGKWIDNHTCTPNTVNSWQCAIPDTSFGTRMGEEGSENWHVMGGERKWEQ